MPALTVWTAISCLQNPGAGTHAFLVQHGTEGPQRIAAFGRRLTTNRQQLFAVIATLVKVQGTVTAVDQAGAKFAVTGPWANQEDLLWEGAPVYLEPAD